MNDFGFKDISPKKVAEKIGESEDIAIYDINDFGFKNINPSTIMERNSDGSKIELYNVNDMGFKESQPFEVINKDGENYKVYDVNDFGLKDINPKRIIEIKSNQQVFGVLMMPSIKSIVYNRNHPNIKTVKKVKQLSKTELNNSGWKKN